MSSALQRWKTTTIVSSALVSAMIGGCTGVIGTQGEPGSSNGPGNTGTGSGGSRGTSTGGGFAGDAPVPEGTDPGRVTMHRLNVVEYDNTMRDLLGTTTRPSVDFTFPVDDRGDSFDNNAQVLSISPLHLRTYDLAATALVNEAMTVAAERTRLVPCDLAMGGETCARSALGSFLPRAWRRPVTAEIDHLMKVVTAAKTRGGAVEAGFKLAIKAALLSPNFIYRIEIDPSPTSLTPHPLGDYEIASRLSYFVWSTMPDDELFAAAKEGTLHDPPALRAHVARMLKDKKAAALVDNFAGQWLFIRKIDEVMPDKTAFPKFDASLRQAMKAETESLFHEIAFNDLPADQLITANFTFVNDRLAEHYGLPLPGSTTSQRVELGSGGQRRGFLSHGSFLTANSHADKTSPVLRGKWVLNELLCTEIPPPPAGANTKIAADLTGATTLRQVLEKHRSDPKCASCHSLMDPIGFGLENYDAVGAYRAMDGKSPVDAKGELPGSRAFSGPAELAQLIAADPDFPRCATQKLYTYALGRSPELTDPNHLDGYMLPMLTNEFAAGGFKFAELVANIVTSPTFLNRRGEPEGGMQ